MKILGFLVVLASIGFTTYWVLSDRKHKIWAITLCLIGIFSGAFFVLNERVTELIIPKVGTLRAAAEQDAQAITQLRQRLEAQSATVDLVAQKATKAGELAESLATKAAAADKKLAQIGEAATSASEEIESVDFAANSALQDISDAYGRIHELEEDKQPPLLTIYEAHPGQRLEKGLRFVVGLDPSREKPLGEVMVVVALPPNGSAAILEIAASGRGPFFTIQKDIDPNGKAAILRFLAVAVTPAWIHLDVSEPTEFQLFGSNGLPPTGLEVPPLKDE